VQTSELEKIDRIEKEIIAFLALDPEKRYNLDRFLRACGLQHLSTSDFIHSENQEMIQVIFDSLSQDQEEPIDYIMGKMDLSQISTELNHSLEPDEDGKQKFPEMRQMEETARLILLTRQINVNQRLKDLRFYQEELSKQDGEAQENKEVMAQIVDLIVRRGQLDRALALPIRIE
jgi:hypothetical protein